MKRLIILLFLLPLLLGAGDIVIDGVSSDIALDGISGSATIIGHGFITEWTVAGDTAARTITLPLYNSGTFDCTINWGDGTAESTVTAYNDADRIHTYASDGTYNVEIKGACPAWSFNNGGDKLKITDIVNWGDDTEFGGFSYLFRGFFGCTNLKSTGVGQIGKSGAGCSNFDSLFRLSPITTVTANIFDLHTAISSDAFDYAFYGCSSLTTIPADLFKYNTLVSADGFRGTFWGCTSLTSIPTDLFKHNTAVSTRGFQYTFRNCTSLTTLPTDLFRYNTAVSTYGFGYTFYGCSSLISIPTDLFRYNTAVSTDGFYGTFYNCTSLTTVPECLFKYNTAVSGEGFNRTFYECRNLQLNEWIFYASGEENTRFFNQSPSFAVCFLRYGFTGNQGKAPELWNCDFGSGTPTTTVCYSGSGNSTTSLSTYASIPAGWK